MDVPGEAQIWPRPTEADDFGSAAAHLIVESGIVPGVTTSCRCSECKMIAKKMDEAGYLSRVKDRWWED